MTGTDVKHQVAIIGVGERPTVLVDYTSDQAKLLKGVGLVFRRPRAARTCWTASSRASRGFKKREAQRPVIVSITPTDQSSATAITTRC